MALADRIAPVLAARAQLVAARQAERADRDAFIVTQFALLGARFDGLLRTALGRHSAFTIDVLPRALAVQGRSFATLAVDTWEVATVLNGTAQGVSFAPVLDFREPDQFGLVECVLDFDFMPGRSRSGRLARRFVEDGVQMRGKRVANLLLPHDDGVAELTAANLEEAFAAWWLR